MMIHHECTGCSLSFYTAGPFRFTLDNEGKLQGISDADSGWYIRPMSDEEGIDAYRRACELAERTTAPVVGLFRSAWCLNCEKTSPGILAEFDPPISDYSRHNLRGAPRTKETEGREVPVCLECGGSEWWEPGESLAECPPCPQCAAPVRSDFVLVD